ncbi:MAG: PRC-barrel domain-containing protein [Phycisphaerales bacterium]
MKICTHVPVLTALMLALAAGAAAPAGAQAPAYGTREAGEAARTTDFRSCHWLSDRKVVNHNGDEIAELSDLIVDRGSGRIEYAVVKTGTTFGLGGRAVAVPYSSLRTEAGKDRFVLASTVEQLKQWPEYTPERWKAMKDADKNDQSELRRRFAADAAVPGDPYSGSFDTAQKTRVEGEVTKVERVRTSTFGEQVIITVEAPDKTTKRVALGPSWYINGTSAAPMRGDKVVVEALPLPRDPDQLLAGTSVRAGERELRLRDSNGQPAWAHRSGEPGRANGSEAGTAYSRYLLLSDLPGMKVDCRGSECGKVQDVIIDRNSGEIGFLSIDPNQNFLGMSDTKRLIPWSVATVALDGTVRLDASKEMVLASPETPGDLATLNGGTHAERVYKAFDVPMPRFEPDGALSGRTPDMGDAWCARGPILGAIERDSFREISGQVVEVTEVGFQQGVQAARALRIRLAGDGGGEQLVLVGPAGNMKNQKNFWATGDSVKVDAYRTRIDGRQYWIAKSIECKDARVVLLDADNAPMWERP